MTVKLCAIVPSHNHHLVLADLVSALCAQKLPVYIIDDGSEEVAQSAISMLHKPKKNVLVTRLENKSGKGGAVITGFGLAAKAGYTHALQIDADGQHDISKLSAIIHLAKAHPEALISGYPIYDHTAPKARTIGRWITHVWVWLETLSFQIKDSMCGFRVYPLTACLEILNQQQIGKHMDFDTEILVRLFWRGTAVHWLPIEVIYPKKNPSNFRVIVDNFRITKMHTRLVFYALFHFPQIIRNRTKLQQSESKWENLEERGMAWGLLFLVFVYKRLGYRVCWLVLQPALLYFFVTGKAQRKASRQFIERIKVLEGNKQEIGYVTSWAHFRSFGRMALDKLAAWMGDIPVQDILISEDSEFDRVLASGEGVLVIASHLGNVEVSRALSKKRDNVRITIFAYTKNAVKFNQLLAKHCPDTVLDVIETSDVGPATVIQLRERIDKGEWIVISGDRNATDGGSRVSYIPFLGKKAAFPQGPMIIASLLKCPVYSLLCLKEDKKYRIHFEKLADKITLPRKDREQKLTEAVAKYVEFLERYCKSNPLQWYNFFDFWKQGQ